MMCSVSAQVARYLSHYLSWSSLNSYGKVDTNEMLVANSLKHLALLFTAVIHFQN